MNICSNTKRSVLNRSAGISQIVVSSGQNRRGDGFSEPPVSLPIADVNGQSPNSTSELAVVRNTENAGDEYFSTSFPEPTQHAGQTQQTCITIPPMGGEGNDGDVLPLRVGPVQEYENTVAENVQTGEKRTKLIKTAFCRLI